MIEYKRLNPEQWWSLSKNANLGVFKETVDPNKERIDFSILILQDDQPIGFVTAQERDAETVHLQYGGFAPQMRFRGLASEVFQGVLNGIWNKYKQCTMLVENTNVAMIKTALNGGFLPIGMRNFKGSILLEFGKEFK